MTSPAPSSPNGVETFTLCVWGLVGNTICIVHMWMRGVGRKVSGKAKVGREVDGS